MVAHVLRSEVARRLELVFPDLLRSSFVLFSVTYSYAIVAYALYCRTPLGQESRDSISDHSMVKRWGLGFGGRTIGCLRGRTIGCLEVLRVMEEKEIIIASFLVISVILGSSLGCVPFFEIVERKRSENNHHI